MTPAPHPPTPPRAVVLCSGGLDSTTVMAMARDEGFDVHALSIDYGQRHRFELEAARRVAEALGAREHRILKVDLGALGGSALTSDALAVPHERSMDAIGTGIPATYVPARNTVFLSMALAWAEVLGAHDVFIGVNAVDYSGYPDCRPEFIEAFERVARLATRAGVEDDTPLRIRAPLIDMTKSEIIRVGLSLGVDYTLTHSCYDPDLDGTPCGDCDACVLRRKGFAECGMEEEGTEA